MLKSPRDRNFCYDCGWLGMCAIACPLADPAHQIPPAQSTAPDLSPLLDDLPFEITLEDESNPDAESGNLSA